MWLSSSLIIWGMTPELSFLHSLAIGACVTPTDPVLSNSIVKGKFADKNIPKDLQKIIIAESGANDGLGYPFLFFALYLIKYAEDGGPGQPGGAKLAMGYWFGETWGYTILLSVIYGGTVGWIAKELLHWAEEKKFVDRESFLVFAITLAVSVLILRFSTWPLFISFSTYPRPIYEICCSAVHCFDAIQMQNEAMLQAHIRRRCPLRHFTVSHMRKLIMRLTAIAVHYWNLRYDR